MAVSSFVIPVFSVMALAGAGANLAVPGLNTAFGMMLIGAFGAW